MKYNHYVQNGINIFEIPDLKGKKIQFSVMASLYEIVGYPDVEEEEEQPEEWEIEEYMEDNECDRDEAIEALMEMHSDSSYESAPTITIESVNLDKGDGVTFDHFEVTVEDVYNCEYLKLSNDEAETVFNYIIKNMKHC